MLKDQDKINELREHYISLFDEEYKKIDPYNYDNIIWDEIKHKFTNIKEEISKIDTDDEEKFKKYYNEYLDEFINFVRGEKTLKSDLLTSREIFIKNIKQISEKVVGGISFVWERTKFLFAIPGCTFASFVFTFFITLVFGTLLVWIFPDAYSETMEGIVDALLATIIYITIRFEIFKDMYINHPELNLKAYLFKHALAILVWWFPITFLKYKVDIQAIIDFNYFEWALYLPYLTLGGFMHEFYYTIYACYALVNIIPFILIVIYVIRMEKFYDARQAIQKKKEKELEGKIEDDSYDYHFVYKDHYGLDENDNNNDEVNAKKRKKNKKDIKK